MNNLIQKLSIAKKALIIMMSLVVVILIINCIIFATYTIVTTKKSLQDEISLIASIIGNRTASALLFFDKEKAIDNLDELKLQPSIKFACLYRPNSDVFATYPETLDKSNCVMQTDRKFIYSFNGLSLYQEVIGPARQKLGTVEIHSDLRKVYNQLAILVLGICVLIASLIIVSYFITKKVQHFITDPIIDLTKNTSKIIKDKNYDIRAIKKYDDETGTLVDTFNTMMQEIKTRDEKIKRINENLEQTVLERTKELEKQIIRAESANAAKTEFLRNMSHELRTPIHGILSFSKFGLNEAHNSEREQLHKYFSRVHMSGERLIKLVDEILTLSKIESGTDFFTFSKNNLHDSVSEALEVTSQLANDKHIKIAYEKPHDIMLNFDQKRITQVIINIIGNAIKYSHENTAITISIEEKKDEVVLSVSDQGKGIPEEELEAIFEKFTQSSRTKTFAGGTGLGLPIAKNFVLAHQGKIWANNNANSVGTTFFILLPKTLAPGNFEYDLNGNLNSSKQS